MDGSQVKWRYRADVITACNCDWGCPCNFNQAPTTGYCEGGWAFKIRTGSCGKVELNGLAFALMAKWPGEIHEGQGTAKLWIEEEASKEQRSALDQIVKGKVKGKPWPIFARTFDVWLDTAFVPFEWKLDGGRSHYKAGDEVLATLEPMRNPVTGAETNAKIVLPDALVCHELNVTSTRSFSVFTTGLKFAAPGKNAWYGSVEHGN
ncbi:MAG: DUF1326 domain-containing protein [Nitrososphaerales archaeon]|nr:DUF1326 domain-containing protein [Nitrososphaerales archaeon]